MLLGANEAGQHPAKRALGITCGVQFHQEALLVPAQASGTGSAGLRKELADTMLCSWDGMGSAVKQGHGVRVKRDPANLSHPFGRHVR